MTNTSWAVAVPVRTQARRRGRPPASDSAVTRERILQAARRVFAESGYEAATFQAIAMEIGLTRPAINNYFSSKSALYAEVVRRAGDAVLAAIQSAGAQNALADQIVEFMRRSIYGAGADPALAGFLVQSAIEAEHLPQFGRESRPAVFIERFVREAVAAAADRGELPPAVDPVALTDTLVGVVWGAAFQVSRGLHRDSARSDGMVDELCTLLQYGVRRAG